MFIALCIIAAVIFVGITIYLIVKYKVDGVLATIGTITNIALLSIIIRLTKITLSMNTFAAFVALLIMNTTLILRLLNNRKENKDKTMGEILKMSYFESIDVIFVTLLLFAVFSFGGMAVISSMGLLLFWGWLVVLLGNLIITNTLLGIKNNR